MQLASMCTTSGFGVSTHGKSYSVEAGCGWLPSGVVGDADLSTHGKSSGVDVSSGGSCVCSSGGSASDGIVTSGFDTRCGLSNGSGGSTDGAIASDSCDDSSGGGEW